MVKAEFCYWHFSDQTLTLGDVRFEEEPGRHLLALSSSQFDPEPTFVVARADYRRTTLVASQTIPSCQRCDQF
jgi:hypothetical protein